jgi:hypothetical protein
MRQASSFMMAAALLMPMAVRGPQSVPSLVDGDYLAESFMKALEQTRSLEQALAQAGVPVRARIEARGSGRLVTRGDFGGDCGAVVVRRDGALEPATPEETGAPAGAVSVVSSVRFTSRLCVDDAAAFVHVGDAGAWISHALLGGRYQDRRGGRFTFGSSGKATFAGRRHTWRVPLDAAADRVEIDGVRHAYTIEAGTLRIFGLQDNGEPAPEPRWSLRRVTTRP